MINFFGRHNNVNFPCTTLTQLIERAGRTSGAYKLCVTNPKGLVYGDPELVKQGWLNKN